MTEESSLEHCYESLADVPYFRPVLQTDLDRVYELETASYPADEAATHDKLKYRIENASNVFLVATTYVEGQETLIGFTCGTCTESDRLTHESMSKHEPEGTTLCIHSVCVAEEYRRRGIARRMLKAYLAYVKATTPGLKEVRLLSKQDLISLYEQAGFILLGPSSVAHGADQWYELLHRYGEDV